MLNEAVLAKSCKVKILQMSRYLCINYVLIYVVNIVISWMRLHNITTTQRRQLPLISLPP